MIQETDARFFYQFNSRCFLETPIGNFEWTDPNYSPKSIRRYVGSFEDWCREEMKVKTTKIAHCKRCCATSNLTSSIMDGLLCERCLTELRRVRGLTAQISNTHTGTPPIVRHKDGTMGNVEKIQGDNLVVNVPSYGKQLWAISDVEYLLERVYDDQVPSR